MSDYIYTGKSESELELKHYGVLGMKWGVRRSLRELRESNASGAKGGHNHAVAVLSSHKEKINKSIAKIDKRRSKIAKKRVELSTKVNKIDKKLIKKGQEFTENGAKNRTKKYGYNKTITKIDKETYKLSKKKDLMSKYLNEIDEELVKNGQDFLYMKPNGLPYIIADD